MFRELCVRDSMQKICPFVSISDGIFKCIKSPTAILVDVVVRVLLSDGFDRCPWSREITSVDQDLHQEQGKEQCECYGCCMSRFTSWIAVGRGHTTRSVLLHKFGTGLNRTIGSWRVHDVSQQRWWVRERGRCPVSCFRYLIRKVSRRLLSFCISLVFPFSLMRPLLVGF